MHGALPAAAAAVLRRAAPVPALAPAGLRAGAAPRRRCCTCSCAACAGRPPRWSTEPVRGHGMAAAGRARRRAVRAARRRAERGRMTTRPVRADADAAVDARRRPAASPLLAAFNAAGRARRPPTCTSRSGSAGSGGEHDERVLLAVALDRPGGALRVGLRAARRPRHASGARGRGRRARRGPAVARRRRRGRRPCWPARSSPSVTGTRTGPRAGSTAGSTSTATGRTSRSCVATSTTGSQRAAPARATRPGSRPPAPGCSRRRRTARQRLAAATAVRSRLTVLTGGPGHRQDHDGRARCWPCCTTPRAAALRSRWPRPTGKAAARLQEAVRERRRRLDRRGPAPASASPEATTVHRLLGWRPGSSTRFRHDRDHHLPHDVVVVDETSMVSLPLMARLLEALRPDARLVLVGDPDQLASVEAGAVLGDLVARTVAGDTLPSALARGAAGRRPARSGGALGPARRRGPARGRPPARRGDRAAGRRHPRRPRRRRRAGVLRAGDPACPSSRRPPTRRATAARRRPGASGACRRAR